MDKLLRYLPTIVVLIAATGSLWWAYDWAYDRGYAAKEAEVRENTRDLEKQLFQVSDRLSETLRQLEIERQQRERLVQEVEDAAREDPDADRPALSADSVLRLRRRWGTQD